MRGLINSICLLAVAAFVPATSLAETSPPGAKALEERIEICVQVLEGADVVDVAPGDPEPLRQLYNATAQRVTGTVGTYTVYLSHMVFEDPVHDACIVAVEDVSLDTGALVLKRLTGALENAGFSAERYVQNTPLYERRQGDKLLTAFGTAPASPNAGFVTPNVVLRFELKSSLLPNSPAYEQIADAEHRNEVQGYLLC
ncbi:MAG: hypothetical protein AAGA15_05235 [Pseudomonadota bacterium]